MTQEIINVGSAPDDGQGDPLRTAFTKTNNNFSQLFSSSANGYSYISNGNSNVNIATANGNITMSASGTANVMVVSNTIVSITGDLAVSGNASLTGNIVGDRITNGTTSIEIPVANGNANITVGGTSNVVVWATTGEYVSGLISATGNVVANNVMTTTIANAASLTGGLVSVTGNITAANLIINGTAAAGSGVLIVSGNIQTSAANATANIGNASNYFNRLFAQSTSAIYSDLAEMYTTDADYAPGTVLVFGGNQEVTMSTVAHDTRVAGVVSTNPAHIMNSGLQGTHTVAVALTGRVPVSVVGNISAGDRVVTSNRAGVAEALDMSRYQPGVIIGKALQSYSSNDVGVIEVVVGRL